MENILPRVKETVSCFLSGFTEDGICLEGLSYWHYGFGFFLCLADLLREYTHGELNYFADPKVRKIAAFAQRMFLGDRATVSFSDSGRGNRYHLGLLHYLKGEYGDEIRLPPRSISYTNDQCGRWGLHLRAFLWFDETLPHGQIEQESTVYAPHAQWLIKRTPAYGFAAKGGRNNEPHNHNDLGSFLVVKDGQQVLCDLGSGIYSRDYFRGPTRYLNLHTSSRGHSVPVINGIYQTAGKEYGATSSFEDGVFTTEIHGGYNLPALTSLTRSFSFGTDHILLQDKYSYDGTPDSFTERFISVVEPQVCDGCVKIGSLTLFADMDAVAAIDVHTETEKHPVWMLDYTLKPDARVFRLKIQV